MIAQRRMDRFQVQFEPSLLMQPPQVRAGFGRVFGHESDAVQIQELGVFVRQAECGGWFGSDDVVALPDRFGQDGHVPGGESFGDLHRSHADRCHSTLDLARVDIDGDAVVFQDRDQSFRKLHVVPVGVDVDEIHDLAAAAAVRSGQPSAVGEAEEASGGQSRQLAPLGDAQEFLQEPPHLAVAEAQLANVTKRLATDDRTSSRARIQSVGVSPLVATYCAFVSSISFGMSTLAGHSSRH